MAVTVRDLLTRTTTLADYDVAWFEDSVSAVFPDQVIPLRLTGVAVVIDGVWKIVQLHMSAAVTDEDLLGG